MQTNVVQLLVSLFLAYMVDISYIAAHLPLSKNLNALYILKSTQWYVWTPSIFSFRSGLVTYAVSHHAKFPAQDAGATLHSKTRWKNTVTWSPTGLDAHPRCWGSKVNNHLPSVPTGRDRCQCRPAGKDGGWATSETFCTRNIMLLMEA